MVAMAMEVTAGTDSDTVVTVLDTEVMVATVLDMVVMAVMAVTQVNWHVHFFAMALIPFILKQGRL